MCWRFAVLVISLPVLLVACGYAASHEEQARHNLVITQMGFVDYPAFDVDPAGYAAALHRFAYLMDEMDSIWGHCSVRFREVSSAARTMRYRLLDGDVSGAERQRAVILAFTTTDMRAEVNGCTQRRQESFEFTGLGYPPPIQ